MQKNIGQKYDIGLTGTLDPFATGLLIITIDRSANKHNDKFLKLYKKYTAKGKLGDLADTFDHTGTIITETNPYTVSQDDTLSAIKPLRHSVHANSTHACCTQTPRHHSINWYVLKNFLAKN